MNVEVDLKNFRIVDLPQVLDHRGTLGFFEVNKHIPFPVERIFYIDGVEEGKSRGAHAHHEGQQFIIALRGSFKIEIDDGNSISPVVLNSPKVGLYVPPMHWLALTMFSYGALCLVLTSNLYDEADYIRVYETFVRKVRGEEE